MPRKSQTMPPTTSLHPVVAAILRRYESLIDYRTPQSARFRAGIVQLVIASPRGFVDSTRFRYSVDGLGELYRRPIAGFATSKIGYYRTQASTTGAKA